MSQTIALFGHRAKLHTYAIAFEFRPFPKFDIPEIIANYTLKGAEIQARMTNENAGILSANLKGHELLPDSLPRSGVCFVWWGEGCG